MRRITWNNVERRSVMASTADIQVNASRGRTTQELQREALSERWVGRGTKQEVQVTELFSLLLLSCAALAIRLNMLTKSCEMMCNHADSHDTDNCSQLHG